jgi:PST family polysaccharide transporter
VTGPEKVGDRPTQFAVQDALESDAAGPTPEPMPTQNITGKAARGFRWGLFGTLTIKFGSFAMSLVLARLLMPADFGAYAVALAVTQFIIHINDIGLIAATVQWRGKLEEMTATASTLALVFSVVIYAIFFVLAEPFANLAGTPEAAGVVRVLLLLILIDGVTAVRAGALMRNFQQDKIALANAAGFVVTAVVTIGLAANGAGGYSFAWGQVIGGVLTGVLILYWAKIPARFGIDRAVTRRLMVFGVPLAASLGVEALVMNADYVIVGNVLGATALGFYLLAFNISSWAPGVIGTAVRYVSIAGFSRLSEKESGLTAGAERALPLLLTGLIPIAVLVGTLSGPMIEVLYGAEWLPAARVLSLLMILTVVRMVTAFALDILTGAGSTRATFWINLGWGIVVIPVLLFATRAGGIESAALAHAVVGVVVALPLTAFALHRVGVRLTTIGRRLVRPLLAGALALVVCLVLQQLPAQPLVRLVVAGTAGLLTYAALAMSRKELRQAMARLRPRAEPEPTPAA